MVSERFEVLNEKEQSLVGVIETDHPRKQQPVAIILNGFLDTMETGQKKLLSKMLRADGFVTVRFDYTYGFGNGTGDVSFFTLTNQVQDVERVIDHATRRGYVDPSKVVLLGHCFGGMGAILLAAFDERVSAVVSISTPYWFEDTKVTRMPDRDLSRMRLKRYFHLHSKRLGKEVRVDYTFFEDGMKKDMARAVRNLEQPLLLIHGENDASIPLANAEEIYNRVPGKKYLEVVDGMEHDPDDPQVKKMYPLIKDFLKKHIKF